MQKKEKHMRASSKRYCLTPKGEFYLIGYGNRYKSRQKPAEGVHDDIYARPVLLEVDGKEIFIFNADYIEFEEWSCNEIRQMMAKEYGLDVNCVLLSATHDHHSVMSYHKNWKSGEFSQEYYDFFVNTVKLAYEECHASLEECEMYYGKGMVEGYYGSRIYYGENADNEVILLECRNKKGEVIAAICNWATHSTVLDPENTLLTADFAGAVCNELHRLRGYYPAMVVGAAGDCSNRAQRQGTDYAELERVSKGAAAEINKISCDKKLELHYEKACQVVYRVNYLPDDERPAIQAKIDELQKRLDVAEDFQSRKLLGDAIGSLSRKLDLGEVDITLFSSILQLGDLEIVSSPAELGSKLGIELKAYSHAKCCIICGYTNGYKSYVLQPELYEDSARCMGSKYRPCDVRGYIDAIKAEM
jgi:hypothetical protein